jgi:SHS2 domain-containing protein
MKKIEFKSHTADIRLKIESDSLPELLMAGLSGMNRLLKKEPPVKNGESPVFQTITINSVDTTTLLIDFLSEILTLSYIHGTIFNEVDFTHISDHETSAIIHGVKVDKFDEDIKAVTYHEADVHKKKNGKWETVIIFDI